MNFFRRQLPLIVAFVTGTLLVAQFFIPHPISRQVNQSASEWFIIVTGIVLVMGVIGVTQVHWMRVYKQEAGWGYSVIFFVGFAAMIVAGVWNQGEQKGAGTAFDWLYENTMMPLQTALFSMLAFFIA